jgi:hypothetical protein
MSLIKRGKPADNGRIFILEGIATCILAPCVYFFLPDTPERSKFLNEAEKEVITASRAAAGNGTASHFEWRYLKDVATG